MDRARSVMLLLSLAAAGCPGTRALASRAPASHSCPVTKPVAAARIPLAAKRPILEGSSDPHAASHLTMYGNRALWVVLPKDAVERVRREPGGYNMKVPTVRLITGQLSAKAQRLDGPARPPHVDVPPGYGTSGFQTVGIIFPASGCWAVTESVAKAGLRFVVEIRDARV